MKELLVWIYCANAVILINHEIDSAYWKEWDLIGMKGGITLFLILHFPMIFAVLYGLLEVSKGTFAGSVFSLVLSGTGIVAFTLHMYFLKKGREEFRTPVSIMILVAALLVSIVQAAVTILILQA
ncbi:MAG TPA: hypothetical protein PK544_10200 [Spirochaetota bacterium]|nr:hypothetical protein [Spirochaetota bacterium]HPJ37293.1 hypothetical protein [Spirochaetota bacterium]HPQ52772.1 hypothetical protein [Spirochaetota bacterium]